MVALLSKPVVVLDQMVIVSGGMLPSKKNVTLQTTTTCGMRFWAVHVTSVEAAWLLTGKSKRQRPLGGLLIFKRLRQEIALARAKLQDSAGDEPKENLWGDAPEQNESPAKRCKFERGKYMEKHPVLSITMPLDDGDIAAGTKELKVLNCRKEIAIEFSAENIEWLIKAVTREVAAQENSQV